MATSKFSGIDGPNCNPDICCGTHHLEGCAGGIPYVQVSAVGGGEATVRWINLETGDLVDTKPAGFLTGTCSDNASMLFTGGIVDPNAEDVADGATLRDNMTYLQLDNGDVVGLWKYDFDGAEWKEVPLAQSVLWVDVAAAPAATGNAPGPRFEITAAGAKYFVDSAGRAEELDTQIDVNLTPVTYVPADTGNTQNLNQVVVDPNGAVWVIDFQGDAVLLEMAKRLDVLTDVQPTPSATGNTDNLMTAFKDSTGTTWIVDHDGDAIATGAPITMAGSLLAAMACIGSPVLTPTGNKDDVQTVGAGGDHADLAAALASGDVVDGTVLKVVSDQVLSATLNVNKAVVIDLNGFTVDSTTAGPGTMFNMTAPLSVVTGGTINHLKATNSAVDNVFTLASTDPTKPVFVTGNTINVMEFGVVARGSYVIADNTFGYIGASLTNSHRYVGIYGNAGESKITGNTFTPIPATSPRYTNFILMTSAAGTVYGGKLYIDGNVQTGPGLRQFFLHEAGAAGGLELYVANNEFDDLNGGIGIISPALYNSYSKIGVFNNTQGASATGNFKGVFFVDGSGALSDTVELTYGGNTATAGPLRADYVSLDAGTENVIAVKNTVTFTEQATAPVVNEESLEALGDLLQELKGRKTYIVDSEGEAIEGNGTEGDPFKLPLDDAGVPTGGVEGQILVVQADGSFAWETLPPPCAVTVKVVTADYTLLPDDEGSLIYVDSAGPVTITAPAGLPAGFIAQIYQKGAGQVTVVGGAGNDLRSANGFMTRVQHSAIGVSYETGGLSNITGDSTV